VTATAQKPVRAATPWSGPVPDLVARGDVPAANMAAALLMLHNIRLG
jgi:hypothetical protein